MDANKFSSDIEKIWLDSNLVDASDYLPFVAQHGNIQDNHFVTDH